LTAGGYDIKRFRCDNGRGEYDNKFFRSILAAREIRFEPAPPYTQHKNGVAERMIGTLTEKARAMMLDSQAPMELWAEAILTACHLHARTPSRALDGKTPYEMLHKQKPELHHLRRFGCIAYKRIPEEQRIDSKMGARSKACMMVGYVHDRTKIWRIWDPEFKKVVQCSDVTFDESRTAHMSCLDNERDALGLPEEEPIYTEEPVDGELPKSVDRESSPKPASGSPLKTAEQVPEEVAAASRPTGECSTGARSQASAAQALAAQASAAQALAAQALASQASAAQALAAQASAAQASAAQALAAQALAAQASAAKASAAQTHAAQEHTVQEWNCAEARGTSRDRRAIRTRGRWRAIRARGG